MFSSPLLDSVLRPSDWPCQAQLIGQELAHGEFHADAHRLISLNPDFP